MVGDAEKGGPLYSLGECASSIAFQSLVKQRNVKSIKLTALGLGSTTFLSLDNRVEPFMLSRQQDQFGSCKEPRADIAMGTADESRPPTVAI